MGRLHEFRLHGGLVYYIDSECPEIGTYSWAECEKQPLPGNAMTGAMLWAAHLASELDAARAENEGLREKANVAHCGCCGKKLTLYTEDGELIPTVTCGPCQAIDDAEDGRLSAELAELRERAAAQREKEWPVRWQCGSCRTCFRGKHLETCPSCGEVGYWSGSFEPPPPGTHVYGDARPLPPAPEEGK